jgi:hypothetical protein
MEPEVSLPRGICREPGAAVPYPLPYFSEILFNIIFLFTPRSSSDLFPSGFATETLCAFLFVPRVLHDLSILSTSS